jgi:hypothetical protein
MTDIPLGLILNKKDNNNYRLMSVSLTNAGGKKEMGCLNISIAAKGWLMDSIRIPLDSMNWRNLNNDFIVRIHLNKHFLFFFYEIPIDVCLRISPISIQ